MRRAMLGAVLALAACTGQIEPAGAPGSGPGTRPPGSTPGTAGPFAPAESSLHRLTRDQYLSTLDDLLPDGVEMPTDLEVDTQLYGFATVGASELSISPRALEQLEAAATLVATQVIDDPARRAAFLGCDPASVSDPCVRTWIETFGRRAWRRPLTTAEVDQAASLASSLEASLGDTVLALRHTMSFILQSPHFVFRVERGEDAGDGTRRYSSYEMASRLSYFLWSTTPDDELLDAAARGELVTDAGVRAQAERLLESPKARASVERFFAEFLSLERLDGVSKSPELFPQATPALLASMRREIQLLFSDIVFERDVDFREIFSTNVTFVNRDLAALYGLPDPGSDEHVRATFPPGSPRGGLMGRAAILTLWSHPAVNSPTLRGRFIRQGLLCQDIPPPPPGVDTTVPEGDGTPMTLRQRLETLHHANPTCATCHLQMDPLGFALEHFDPIGQYRTDDEGLPIDVRTEVDGAPVDGASELGLVLADNPEVGACVARRLYRFAVGHLETEGEEAAIVALARRFETSGYRFKELLIEVVLSDGFRLAGGQR